MGEAENSQAEADDISSRSQKDRSSSESTLGEGEARRVSVGGSVGKLSIKDFHRFMRGPFVASIRGRLSHIRFFAKRTFSLLLGARLRIFWKGMKKRSENSAS